MRFKKSSLFLIIAATLFSTISARAEWACYYQRTDEVVINDGQMEYPVFVSYGSFESTTKAKAWAACQADKQGGAFACRFMGCE